MTAVAEPDTAPVDDQADGDQLIYPTIISALNQVMADLGAVGKSQTAPSQMGGYKFRGIDDLLNALHPVLTRHGVLVLPTVLDRTDDKRETDKGKTFYSVSLHVLFTFYGPGGDSLSCSMWGEGQDFNDKATSKAASMAMKYALLQALCIPTEGIADGDAGRGDTELLDAVSPRTQVETLLQQYGRSWPELADIMAARFPDGDTSVEALKGVNRPNQVTAIRDALADHAAQVSA